MNEQVKGSVPEVSVVVPVFNEEHNIPLMLERLRKVFAQMQLSYEVVMVDDGSRDGSLALLRKLVKEDGALRYRSFSRNFGHQIATSAGLDAARGKVVVVIDGDLQDPPELIPELYRAYDAGAKVVVARRRRRKGESWAKRLTAALFYRLMRRITHIDIPLDTGDFRLMDAQVVQALKAMPEHHKFLRGQIAWLGFPTAEVTYDRDARHAGRTGYTYRKMLRFAFDGITAFSNTPLKLASVLGFFFSMVAFIIILYALYSRFFLNQTITGWTSLIISSMFMGGVQLFTLGIMGEYLSRINSDVRGRPLYVVAEEGGKD
jgi:dolichol-phosphate mannosyltransferase